MEDLKLFGEVPFDTIMRTDEGGEHWTGRDLMPVMDYRNWEDFLRIIQRAKSSAKNSGHDPDQAFSVITEKGTGGRSRIDVRLTRFAAYLVAMNGDPNKREVAAAQAYFAVKTREAEVSVPQPRTELTRRDLAEMVIAEADRADAAEAKVVEMAPAAQSWNVLASGDGDYSVGDAAKILSRDPQIQVGERRLFTILHEHGWTYRQRGDQKWRAYQVPIDVGRLSELPQSHYHPNTGELVLDPPQVRVTPKGLSALRSLLGGTTPLELEELPAHPGR